MASGTTATPTAAAKGTDAVSSTPRSEDHRQGIVASTLARRVRLPQPGSGGSVGLRIPSTTTSSLCSGRCGLPAVSMKWPERLALVSR